EACRARDDRRRVSGEPLFEEGAVEGSEIERRLQISLVVEPAREAGELAQHLTLDPGADEESHACRAVVGSEGAVFLTAAAELAPHMDDHAVGKAAGLEVALEGVERGGSEGESAREVRRLVGMCVVHPRRADRETAKRQSSGDHGREAGETRWEGI